MFKNNTSALSLRFVSERLTFITIVLLAACFLLSATGQMQIADEQPINEPQSELTAPQAVRPDILWMRSGTNLQANESQPYYFNDRQRFMTCSEGTVKYWRASDGMLLKTIFVSASLSSNDCALSPNNDKIVVLDNSAIKIFNAADGTLATQITFPGFPAYVVFNPNTLNGQNFAVGFGGGTFVPIRRYGVDGSLLNEYMNSVNPANYPTIKGSPAFSPDGQWISGTKPGDYDKLEIVRVSDGLKSGFKLDPISNYNNTIFSPDGQYIIAPLTGGVLGVWVLSSVCVTQSGIPCNLIKTLTSSNVNVRNLVFSPDGTKLAAGGSFVSNNVPTSFNQIWQTSNYNLIRSYDSNNSGNYATVAFADNSSLLSLSYNFKLWNVNDGTLIQDFHSHPSILRAVAYSPDGQIVASGVDTYNGTIKDPGVRLWRASDGTFLRTLDFGAGTQGSINSISFSPDSSMTAVSGHAPTNTPYVKIFDTNTGNLLHSYASIGRGAVVFSPNANANTFATDGGIYRVSDGTRITTINFFPVPVTLSFSSNGDRLTDGIKVYSTTTGAVLYNLTGAGFTQYVNGTAFSPNDQIIASVYNVNGNSGTYKVKLFNGSDGTLLRELNGHTSYVDTLAFAPDSNTIFTGSRDGTLRFWDVANGNLLQTFDDEIGIGSGTGYPQTVSGAYSPDGKFFIYGRSVDTTLVKARNPFYSNACAPVQSGMTAWYKAEGNANDSAGTNNGTLQNGTAFATGKVNQAFNLDGVNDFVQVPHTASLNVQGSFSAAAWIYPESFPNSSPRIFQKGSVTNANQWLMTVSQNGELQVTINLANAPTTAANAIPLNAWSHVAFTYDNTTGELNLFVNGLPSGGTFNIGSQTTNNTEPLEIGGLSFNSTRFFDGRIDESLLYNRALTNAEIQSIYNSAGVGVCQPSVNYTINGQITDGTNPLSGVSVTLSGSSSGTMMTDAFGNYSFTVAESGSYTITPTLLYHTFNQASQTFNLVYANQTANFVASRNTNTISGNITRNGSPLSGVSVALSGSQTGAATTDASGNYSLTVAQGGSYTVTPSLSGHIFTPTSSPPFNTVVANQTANFTALFSTYTISGNVKADGANLSGATLILSGSLSTATTSNASGNYTFTVSTNGNYTVTVFKNGFTFNPANKDINNVQANRTADFQNGIPLCAPSPPGMLAWIKGEGDAADSSSNGDNGTIQGGVTYTTGKTGQAFNLNGTSGAVKINQVGNNLNYGASDFTISTWIKFTETGRQRVLYANGYHGNDAVLILLNTSSQPELFIRDGSNNTIDFAAGGALNDGNWHYVVGVRSGTTGQLYVDGILVGSSTNPSLGTINASCGFDWIGANNTDSVCAATANKNFFGGSIDEFTIYRRALTAAEIQNIYNGGSTGMCANLSGNLAAWYKGEANTTDSTGNTTDTPQGGIAYAAGKVGQAFNFNGTNSTLRIDNSAASVNFGASDFTIQAWVKFTATGTLRVLYINGFSGSSTNELLIDSGSHAQLFLRDSASNQISIVGTSVLNDNAWHHIAGVRQGTTGRLFVDGAQEGFQTNFSFGSINSSCTFGFVSGANASANCASPTNSNFFGGLIDEFIIHRRALSASEIQNIYNAGSVGALAGTAAFTNTNDKIAFTSLRDGNREIYAMNADGSSQARLTNSAAVDDQPAFSPNGSRIVFASSRDGNYEIYSMNSDGSNQIRLTNNAAADTFPKFSPDGSRIAFISDRDGNSEIYAMNSFGSGQIRLTNSVTTDEYPRFSPNGAKIIFTSLRDGNREIYMMNADGTNQTRLTNNAAVDDHAEFSPDGAKIIFSSTRDGNYEIYLMNADGTNPIRLTNNAAADTFPEFSPDGSRVAFVTARDGNDEIYSMNADGSGQTRLTNSATDDQYPSWQHIASGITVAPADKINLTFANVTQAGNTVATPLTENQLPVLPINYTFPANAPMYDIRTSAAYSGNIIVTFDVPSVADAVACSNLRILHFENSAWSAANNTTPTFNAGTCTVSQTVTSLSPFAITQLAGPSAASVTIGGRVTTVDGNGIRNAFVTLTNSQGNSQTTLTGKFGAYRFREVTAGETYIISVRARRFTFSQSSQVRTVTDDLTDIDFVASNNSNGSEPLAVSERINAERKLARYRRRF